MKGLAILGVFVVLALSLIVGCDQAPRLYSFVVITDLHIGYGIPNYYPEYQTRSGSTWLDGLRGSPGENDSQAEILKAVVEKIIEQKNSYNIKFVVVLGDISDTAERSEFLTARAILNRLNDAGIAYIPLIGNHDTWPYTQPEDGFSPGDRSRHETIAGYAAGDYLFNDVFWGAENNGNIQLIKNLFGNSWQKAGVPVDDFPEVNHSVHLQNYGFSYQGITFVALDLAPRAEPLAKPGFPIGFVATDHEQTVEFARNYTRNYPPDNKTVILFSHYGLNPSASALKFVSFPPEAYLLTSPESYYTVYNFAGHRHVTSELGREISTEDTGEIPLFPGERTNAPIRIVQIRGNEIDYSTLLPKGISVPPTATPVPTPTPTATPQAGIRPCQNPSSTSGSHIEILEVSPTLGTIVSPGDYPFEIKFRYTLSEETINKACGQVMVVVNWHGPMNEQTRGWPIIASIRRPASLGTHTLTWKERISSSGGIIYPPEICNGYEVKKPSEFIRRSGEAIEVNAIMVSFCCYKPYQAGGELHSQTYLHPYAEICKQ